MDKKSVKSVKGLKSLVIVESPAKARTLGKFLGDSFCVLPSYGHIIDLPRSSLGVDIEAGFKPEYVVLKAKQKTLAQIRKEAKAADKIYLATDPDREGEAIGWHLQNNLSQAGAKTKKPKAEKEFLRVEFHEITKQAVEEAFKHPRKLDINLINAQQARRILDRILGYLLSPLLWKKISRGLSAGRVQSIALRLIVEREREIIKFVPEEYWSIEANFSKENETRVFAARLDKIDGEKAALKNMAEAEKITALLKSSRFMVEDIAQTEKKRNPSAPFVTSTLQQAAFNKLGFTAHKTMALAQALYEGIDLPEGPQGLITYMRTDSPKVAESAITEVRGFINEKFGADYLPLTPNQYKPKKSAQEAHEAIRPTAVARRPQDLEQVLDNDLLRLYELIWKRFVASQMKPALYSNTSVDIKATPPDNDIGKSFFFRASGSRPLFAGFSAVYIDEDEEKEGPVELPALNKADNLALEEITPSQHFTKPPPRFSDASLVKLLEENGIGRPSTYAPILQTLIFRDYVRRVSGYLNPTELGMKVVDLLVEYFANVMNVEFTAQIEEELDEIEEGKIEYAKILKEFYAPFKQDLDFAHENIKKEVVYTDEICPECQKPMVIKWGKGGKFLSCSGFPQCKFAKSITTGVKCPEAGCAGELVERRGFRGRFFYGCTKYPLCKFTANKLPAAADEQK